MLLISSLSLEFLFNFLQSVCTNMTGKIFQVYGHLITVKCFCLSCLWKKTFLLTTKIATILYKLLPFFNILHFPQFLDFCVTNIFNLIETKLLYIFDLANKSIGYVKDLSSVKTWKDEKKVFWLYVTRSCFSPEKWRLLSIYAKAKLGVKNLLIKVRR